MFCSSGFWWGTLRGHILAVGGFSVRKWVISWGAALLERPVTLQARYKTDHLWSFALNPGICHKTFCLTKAPRIFSWRSPPQPFTHMIRCSKSNGTCFHPRASASQYHIDSDTYWAQVLKQPFKVKVMEYKWVLQPKQHIFVNKGGCIGQQV